MIRTHTKGDFDRVVRDTIDAYRTMTRIRDAYDMMTAQCAQSGTHQHDLRDAYNAGIDLLNARWHEALAQVAEMHRAVIELPQHSMISEAIRLIERETGPVDDGVGALSLSRMR